MLSLGQTLKSFRDSRMEFGVYQPGARAEGPLAELGPLQVPGRADNKLDS